MGELDDIVTAETQVGVDLMLKAAQKRVRAYCGWHIAPILTLSGSLNLRGGRVLRLPALRVAKLTRLVTREGIDLLDSTVMGSDGLVESLDAPFPTGVAAVSYEMEAGFPVEEVPNVVAVILQMTKRAMNAPAGIVKQQSVNGASAAFDMTGGGAPAVNLLASEMRDLDEYRLGWRP